MTDWQHNLPPGCLPYDVSDRPSREEDDDDWAWMDKINDDKEKEL